MKNILIIFSVIISILFGVSLFKSQESIIGLEFKNHKEVESLFMYSKVSDTSLVDEFDFEPIYSVLHLRDASKNLILFSDISRDKDDKRAYKIIDTLVIPKVKKHEFITIGYCVMGSKTNVNLIGIVNKSKSQKIKDIKKIWKINTVSNKIEKVVNLNGIECWNEFL